MVVFVEERERVGGTISFVGLFKCSGGGGVEGEQRGSHVDVLRGG